jgi:hypothetical protein
MANWREQKREARRIVHNTMALDMKFFQTATSSPVDVRARLHTKFTQIGDDRSMGWAEIEAIKPRIIFMLDELPAGLKLDRNAVVLVQPGEAYNIDNTLPADDISVTAEVTRLTKRDYEKMGLPLAGSQP